MRIPRHASGLLTLVSALSVSAAPTGRFRWANTTSIVATNATSLSLATPVTPIVTSQNAEITNSASPKTLVTAESSTSNVPSSITLLVSDSSLATDDIILPDISATNSDSDADTDSDSVFTSDNDLDYLSKVSSNADTEAKGETDDSGRDFNEFVHSTLPGEWIYDEKFDTYNQLDPVPVAEDLAVIKNFGSADLAAEAIADLGLTAEDLSNILSLDSSEPSQAGITAWLDTIKAIGTHDLTYNERKERAARRDAWERHENGQRWEDQIGESYAAKQEKIANKKELDKWNKKAEKLKVSQINDKTLAQFASDEERKFRKKKAIQSQFISTKPGRRGAWEGDERRRGRRELFEYWKQSDFKDSRDYENNAKIMKVRVLNAEFNQKKEKWTAAKVTYQKLQQTGGKNRKGGIDKKFQGKLKQAQQKVDKENVALKKSLGELTAARTELTRQQRNSPQLTHTEEAKLLDTSSPRKYQKPSLGFRMKWCDWEKDLWKDSHGRTIPDVLRDPHGPSPKQKEYIDRMSNRPGQENREHGFLPPDTTPKDSGNKWSSQPWEEYEFVTNGPEPIPIPDSSDESDSSSSSRRGSSSSDDSLAGVAANDFPIERTGRVDSENYAPLIPWRLGTVSRPPKEKKVPAAPPVSPELSLSIEKLDSSAAPADKNENIGSTPSVGAQEETPATPQPKDQAKGQLSDEERSVLNGPTVDIKGKEDLGNNELGITKDRPVALQQNGGPSKEAFPATVERKGGSSNQASGTIMPPAESSGSSDPVGKTKKGWRLKWPHLLTPKGVKGAYRAIKAEYAYIKSWYDWFNKPSEGRYLTWWDRYVFDMKDRECSTYFHPRLFPRGLDTLDDSMEQQAGILSNDKCNDIISAKTGHQMSKRGNWMSLEQVDTPREQTNKEADKSRRQSEKALEMQRKNSAKVADRARKNSEKALKNAQKESDKAWHLENNAAAERARQNSREMKALYKMIPKDHAAKQEAARVVKAALDNERVEKNNRDVKAKERKQSMMGRIPDVRKTGFLQQKQGMPSHPQLNGIIDLANPLPKLSNWQKKIQAQIAKGKFSSLNSANRPSTSPVRGVQPAQPVAVSPSEVSVISVKAAESSSSGLWQPPTTRPGVKVPGSPDKIPEDFRKMRPTSRKRPVSPPLELVESNPSGQGEAPRLWQPPTMRPEVKSSGSPDKIAEDLPLTEPASQKLPLSPPSEPVELNSPAQEGTSRLWQPPKMRPEFKNPDYTGNALGVPEFSPQVSPKGSISPAANVDNVDGSISSPGAEPKSLVDMKSVIGMNSPKKSSVSSTPVEQPSPPKQILESNFHVPGAFPSEIGFGEEDSAPQAASRGDGKPSPDTESKSLVGMKPPKKSTFISRLLEKPSLPTMEHNFHVPGAFPADSWTSSVGSGEQDSAPPVAPIRDDKLPPSMDLETSESYPTTPSRKSSVDLKEQSSSVPAVPAKDTPPSSPVDSEISEYFTAPSSPRKLSVNSNEQDSSPPAAPTENDAPAFDVDSDESLYAYTPPAQSRKSSVDVEEQHSPVSSAQDENGVAKEVDPSAVPLPDDDDSEVDSEIQQEAPADEETTTESPQSLSDNPVPNSTPDSDEQNLRQPLWPENGLIGELAEAAKLKAEYEAKHGKVDIEHSSEDEVDPNLDPWGKPNNQLVDGASSSQSEQGSLNMPSTPTSERNSPETPYTPPSERNSLLMPPTPPSHRSSLKLPPTPPSEIPVWRTESLKKAPGRQNRFQAWLDQASSAAKNELLSSNVAWKTKAQMNRIKSLVNSKIGKVQEQPLEDNWKPKGFEGYELDNLESESQSIPEQTRVESERTIAPSTALDGSTRNSIAPQEGPRPSNTQSPQTDGTSDRYSVAD